MKKYFLFILLSIIIISCSDLSVSPDLKKLDNYGIVFILYSWTDYQIGVLSKTDKPTAPGNSAVFVNNFVDSAIVSINGNIFTSIPNDSVITSNRKHMISHLVNYYSTDINIIPNSVYKLNITINNKNILSGTTSLPPKVEFTDITDDDKYYYIYWKEQDSLLVNWEIVDSISSVYSSESSFVNFAKIGKKFIKKGEEYLLRVNTFDKNLTKYKSKQVARSGINKEFGVFGSITRTTKKITFH